MQRGQSELRPFANIFQRLGSCSRFNNSVTAQRRGSNNGTGTATRTATTQTTTPTSARHGATMHHFRVGFVGVGYMGKGMVKNILCKHNAPFKFDSLALHDGQPGNVEALVRAHTGAFPLHVASSAAEVAVRSDVVCLSLPSEEITRSVMNKNTFTPALANALFFFPQVRAVWDGRPNQWLLPTAVRNQAPRARYLRRGHPPQRPGRRRPRHLQPRVCVGLPREGQGTRCHLRRRCAC